jgi:hypothetical protein
VRESQDWAVSNRLQFLTATVPATLALVGTLALGAVTLATDDDPSPPQTCEALVGKVADLAEKHRDLADLYAKGAENLPRLADAEERKRCGDPLVLLQELAE